MMKFNFINSKIREKHFSTETVKGKNKISKHKGAIPSCTPLPTPMNAVLWSSIAFKYFKHLKYLTDSDYLIIDKAKEKHWG